MAIKRGSRTVPARKTRAVPRRITRRRQVSASEFVFPADRRYPIPDAYHATLALESLLRVAGRHGVSEERREDARRVLAAVRRKFPGVYEGESDLVGKVRSRFRLGGGSGGSALDGVYRRHRVR